MLQAWRQVWMRSLVVVPDVVQGEPGSSGELLAYEFLLTELQILLALTRMMWGALRCR